jgi:hypothetical protein
MDETVTYGEGGFIAELAWDTYPEGRCLLGDLTEGRRINSNHQVECTEPHDLQIFHGRAVFDLPAEYGKQPVDTGYPNQADLIRFAELSCRMAFDSDQVAGDDKTTELRYRALVPTKEEWEKKTRGVYCALYDKDDGGQLTESRVALTDG